MTPPNLLPAGAGMFVIFAMITVGASPSASAQTFPYTGSYGFAGQFPTLFDACPATAPGTFMLPAAEGPQPACAGAAAYCFIVAGYCVPYAPNSSCPANSTRVSGKCTCDSGFKITAAGNACVPAQQSDYKNLGRSCSSVGNPINCGAGNKYAVEEDYRAAGPFPLRFTRSYNSLLMIDASGIGAQWRHTYASRIDLVSPTQVRAYRADGRMLVFNLV
ncbi:MAG: DUF6531 domain-containing protein, partial [bacterium]